MKKVIIKTIISLLIITLFAILIELLFIKMGWQVDIKSYLRALFFTYLGFGLGLWIAND